MASLSLQPARSGSLLGAEGMVPCIGLDMWAAFNSIGFGNVLGGAEGLVPCTCLDTWVAFYSIRFGNGVKWP